MLLQPTMLVKKMIPNVCGVKEILVTLETQAHYCQLVQAEKAIYKHTHTHHRWDSYAL